MSQALGHALQGLPMQQGASCRRSQCLGRVLCGGPPEGRMLQEELAMASCGRRW